MGQPAARLTDMHVCPMVTGVVPHVGGPIVMGSFNVFTGKLPQAKVMDPLVCVGPPDMIAKGSTGVFVNKLDKKNRSPRRRPRPRLVPRLLRRRRRTESRLPAPRLPQRPRPARRPAPAATRLP